MVVSKRLIIGSLSSAADATALVAGITGFVVALLLSTTTVDGFAGEEAGVAIFFLSSSTSLLNFSISVGCFSSCTFTVCILSKTFHVKGFHHFVATAPSSDSATAIFSVLISGATSACEFSATSVEVAATSEIGASASGF